MPWMRSADGDRQLSDAESCAKSTSWSGTKTACEASYLSADFTDAESSAKPTSWSEMKRTFEASYLSAVYLSAVGMTLRMLFSHHEVGLRQLKGMTRHKQFSFPTMRSV